MTALRSLATSICRRAGPVPSPGRCAWRWLGAGHARPIQHRGRHFAARGTRCSDQLSLRHRQAETFPHAVQDAPAAIQLCAATPSRSTSRPTDRRLRPSAGGNLGALAALGGRSPIFANGYPQVQFAKESTEVKVFAGVYGVYDVAQMWQKYNAQSPLQNSHRLVHGCAAAGKPRPPPDGSPISYANGRQQQDRGAPERRHRGRPGRAPGPQTDAFLLALKQAGFLCAPPSCRARRTTGAVIRSTSPGSFSGFLAPRLMRFLAEKL